MVFLSRGGQTYKVKVRVPGRRAGTFSCGTRDETVAQDVERMVVRFAKRRQWAPLLAVLDKRVRLAALYDADVQGRIDALLAEVADTDLSPLVEELLSSERYRTQVRALIPKGKRFPVSRFSRGTISRFLDGLACGNATKNRYRAALSVFAGRLVEREVIEHNPVRDVRGKTVTKTPPAHLRPEQYQRLVAATTDPQYRALFALLYGTGMEIGAALAVTREDVNEQRRTVWAHGTKTESRNRECAVDEWAWPIVWAYAKQFMETAKLWEPQGYTGRAPRDARHGVSAASAYRAHAELLKHLKYPPMRLHNTRHSFAICHRRQGDADAWIAQQLGHTDTIMVQKTYGAFKPDPVADQRAVATNPATSEEKLHHVR